MSRMADYAAEVACGAQEPMDPKDAPGSDKPREQEPTTRGQLQAWAEELAASWVNGNLTHVVGELGENRPVVAAFAAATIALLLDGKDADAFRRRLLGEAENAIEEGNPPPRQMGWVDGRGRP